MPTFDNTNVTSWMQGMSSSDWRTLGSDILSYGMKSAFTSRFTVSSNLQDAMDVSDTYDTSAKDRAYRDCNAMADWIDNGGVTQLTTDIYDSGVTPTLESVAYLYLNFRKTWLNFYLVTSCKIVIRSQ